MNGDQKRLLLKALPKVDECIQMMIHSPSIQNIPLRLIKAGIQNVIEYERENILNDQRCCDHSPEEWRNLFLAKILEKSQPRFRRVINGTGVIIHTNLGRSVLSAAAAERLKQAAEFYSNLEFNLETGKRGSRYSLVEEAICELTGAEAALVVNNNAAAVLIALDTLAKGRQVIVSRGQLVEIGGSFRIPDVMAKSGAKLMEVGATNRTHLADYEQAINEETVMLLRVHTSNFRIIGFTLDVAAEELVALAQKKQLITMEDLGSGSLIDFSPWGFPKEPTVQEIVRAGVDVVTFSGDKLLGGPQAGIIVGKNEIIGQIKKNPLNRALRIDKFTLASLEAVLVSYYDEQAALKNIPTLAMLTISAAELKKRAQKILGLLKKDRNGGVRYTMIPTVSRVGGGALPELNLQSWAIAIEPLEMKITSVEKNLRRLEIPIVGRIENDRMLLDVRTIQDQEIKLLVKLLGDYFANYEEHV